MLGRREGLSPESQLAVFGIALLMIFSRWPALLIHAQFYAEDGAVWYAQAYNTGWLHSLTMPQAGYLQTLPRLGVGLALLFPLHEAPLVMTLLGMAIQCLPVLILLSPRCRDWAPLPVRLVLAAIYIALPNAREVHVVLTNGQWHLALAESLLAFARPPQSWPGRVFDVVVFLIGGFSGPFCIVLAPMVLLYWWERRQRWSLVITAVMSVGAVAEFIFLMHSTDRDQGELGARFITLVRMVGGDVVTCAVFGAHSFALRVPWPLLLVIAVGGLTVIFYCMRFAKLEWKLFLLYTAALFAASLHNPLMVNGRAPKPLWDLLVGDYSARYWFLPTLAFLWSAVWCARYARSRLFKIAGKSLLFLTLIGMLGDWEYKGYIDENFPAFAQEVEKAKPGTLVTIPIVPEGWHMDLVKKSASATGR